MPTTFVELDSAIRSGRILRMPRVRARQRDERGETDSLPVPGARKRLGLKSHLRLSEVLIKLPSITSSDSFNLSSARLNKPQGPDLCSDTVYRDRPDPTGAPSQPKGRPLFKASREDDSFVPGGLMDNLCTGKAK
jgi:hypothetical protein